MKVILYTNSLSPHQLPLMREFVDVYGADNVLYAYEEKGDSGRAKLGWEQKPEAWCREAKDCRKELEDCDVLLVGGLRPIDLMERRVASGKTTWYMSERWFKPPIGMLRLLHPAYFAMARRFVQLMSKENAFKYLPIGIHAARDMARLCRLMQGDLRCLFSSPKLEFERKPGGRIWLKDEPRNTRSSRKYCLDKMRMWGYFVRSSVLRVKSLELQEGSRNQAHCARYTTHDSIRVLWVGRLLNWKRVDTIIRAVGDLVTHSSTHPLTHSQLSLDIYGVGPEEVRLKKLAANYGDVINFHPPVPIDDVRKLMREHDVYVLSSNAYEGWGAVVSEALEEGMKVIGTYEAGSSATMLPEGCLFHAGDWRWLSQLLSNDILTINIGKWSAHFAANALNELRKI